MNAHEEETGPTEIFNFSQLQDNTLSSSLHEETSTSDNFEQETTSRPLSQKRVILRLWQMATHQKENPVRFFL